MSYTLTAELRKSDTKLDALRLDKQIPGILYGDGIKENQSVQLSTKEFNGVYEDAGESQVVELHLGKDKHDIIVREVQIDPVTREPIHVDLFSIDVNKPVEVELPLEFTGVAPAVKASGGSLMKNLDTLSIKCLPKNLVKSILVPLEKLETIDDNITVNDLLVPEGIEVMADMSEMVATVIPPRIEAVEPIVPAEGEEAAGEQQAENGETSAEGTEGKPKDSGESK